MIVIFNCQNLRNPKLLRNKINIIKIFKNKSNWNLHKNNYNRNSLSKKGWSNKEILNNTHIDKRQLLNQNLMFSESNKNLNRNNN